MCRNVNDLQTIQPQINQIPLLSILQKAHRGGVEVHGGGGKSPSVGQDRKDHPQTCRGAAGWGRASAVERWVIFWFSMFCNLQTQ